MKYREDNMAKLLPNEIALDNYEDVNTILPILVNNGYAVMVTREENLWIVNYPYVFYSIFYILIIYLNLK